MPRASSGACVRCKRAWTSPNPLVKDPAPENTLKRRGQANFCQPCFSYCSCDPQFKQLSAAEIVTKIDEDQASYDSGLTSWEESRREGGRRSRNPDRSTQVTGEVRNAVSTKQLLGYLWPQALLKKHGLLDLWTKGPRQTIIHFGQKLTGVMREVNGVGAVEVTQDSQIAAVRAHQVCDREADEQDEADDVHQSLTKQLKLTQDDDGNGLLKGKKKGRDDFDDFFGIWGVSGAVSSSGSKDKDNDEDATDAVQTGTPKPNKRPRKEVAKASTFSGAGCRLSGGTTTLTVNAQGGGDDSTTQPDSSTPQFGSSASWLFGGSSKIRGAKGKGAGKGSCKELDLTDKILQQYDNTKVAFASDASFMSITFAKVTTMAEKLQGRSSEECLKLLRDLTASGSGTDTERALSIMRRLSAANSEVAALCQVVSAVHDMEASAATLLEGINEAKSAGISLPGSLHQMYHARALKEECKSGNWQGFLDMLQCAEIGAMFGTGSEQDALIEFQFCSFRSSLSKLLQQEVSPADVQKPDPNVPSPPISEEEKSRREAAKNQAMKARALELANGVKDFLHCFLESPLSATWSQHPSVASFVVEIENLKKVADAACMGEALQLHADDIDTLRSARLSVVNKKAAMHECMTLFPLGQFIQQMCNAGLEAWHRDRALAADLESCITTCSQMKSFTADMLLKGEAPEITIQVPGQAKLCEVVQKMNMIQNTASPLFLQEFSSQVALVETKMQEVRDALFQACARKFHLVCGDAVLGVLSTILSESLTADLTAKLIEKINSAKAFSPCSQALLQKCIGMQAQEVISVVTGVRDFFGAFAAALPGLVALWQAAGDAALFSPSRLLHAEMTKFMAAWASASTRSALQEMAPEIDEKLSAVVRKICENALLPECISFGFINFVVFLTKGDASEDMKTIVGEFQGDEDKVMLDFEGIFEQYSIELARDWYPLQEGDLQLSSSAICAAGSVLPLAKMVVHMSSWTRSISLTTSTALALQKGVSNPKDLFVDCIMTNLGSKEHEAGKFMHCLRRASQGANTTQQQMAAEFVNGCLVKGAHLFLKAIEIATADFRELRDTLHVCYKQFDGLVEFNASLDEGKIDSVLTDRLCQCPSMQKCFLFLSHGPEMLESLQKFLVGLEAAATQGGQGMFRCGSAYQPVAQAANASIQELKAFMVSDWNSKVTIEELKASLNSESKKEVEQQKAASAQRQLKVQEQKAASEGQLKAGTGHLEFGRFYFMVQVDKQKAASSEGQLKARTGHLEFDRFYFMVQVQKQKAASSVCQLKAGPAHTVI
ncbi:unnamed protein product [Symbiodinium sp. CCMP2592]|nr:unnamed protein product [Symbiodinium sp. CCMP2592]